MTDPNVTVMEILAGQHDDSLLRLIEAIQLRLQQEVVQTRWRIRYDDLEVTEETITVAEMRTVTQLLSAARGERVSWLDVDPASEPGDFIAILATVMQTRGGVDLAEAQRTVGDIPMSEIPEHLDEYVLVPAPKD